MEKSFFVAKNKTQRKKTRTIAIRLKVKNIKIVASIAVKIFAFSLKKEIQKKTEKSKKAARTFG